MRKWWLDLPPGLRVAIIAVVAFAFYTGGALIFGEKFISAPFRGLFYALILAGGTYVAQKRFRRTAARLEEHGQVADVPAIPECPAGFLERRLADGCGHALAKPDRLPAGRLRPTHSQHRSRALTGLGTTGLPPRTAGRDDKKQAVPFDFEVITLDSDGGVIEIAASPATVKKILEAVGPASS